MKRNDRESSSGDHEFPQHMDGNLADSCCSNEANGKFRLAVTQFIILTGYNGEKNINYLSFNWIIPSLPDYNTELIKN